MYVSSTAFSILCFWGSCCSG